MEKLIRRDFVSWEQPFGGGVRAVALTDGHWFMEAMNCCRDGDMGNMGDDGVYSRTWATDDLNVYGAEEYDYRPASPSEVDLYLKHCGIDWDENEEVVAIVRGTSSYVLYKKKDGQD